MNYVIKISYQDWLSDVSSFLFRIFPLNFVTFKINYKKIRYVKKNKNKELVNCSLLSPYSRAVRK